MRRKRSAFQPAFKPFLFCVGMGYHGFGNVGVVWMRRRDVQNHADSRIRLKISLSPAEHPVHDLCKLSAGDIFCRIGGVPVEPTPLGREAESRPGLLIRFQIGEADRSCGRRIKTAQEFQKFRPGHPVVRIEPVSLQDAQILQRCGCLITAVIFFHIQKLTFSCAVQIQQVVQDADQFPHRDWVVHSHNAVLINGKIGDVFFSRESQSVSGGIDGILGRRHFRFGFRCTVRTLPVQEGISFQFNRLVQGCTAPGGYCLNKISLVRDQVSQFKCDRFRLPVQLQQPVRGGAQQQEFHGQQQGLYQGIGSSPASGRPLRNPCRGRAGRGRGSAKGFIRQSTRNELCRCILAFRILRSTLQAGVPNRSPRLTEAPCALLPFPVKVKVRIAHAADSPSGSSCAMLRSTISRITVSASTCSKAARE